MEGQPPAKRSRLEEQNQDTEIPSFLKWLTEEGVTISQKIQIAKQGSCARYGAIAVENIDSGEVLFTIPRKLVLSEKNCPIALSLSQWEFTDESGWVKLIMCLMTEYTNSYSKWKPYMKFIPPIECMDQPMFWSKSERTDFLKGTGLDIAVELDEIKIDREYRSEALPFIRQHSNLGFDPNIHTLQLYRHMVAFVMAYSFTEPDSEDENTPMMVPLGDVLNHVAKHNAELEFGENELVMKSIEFIPSGQEVYNTYGQISNMQLLQMYGFVQDYPHNIFDTVDVELSLLFDAASNNLPYVDEKRKWLNDEINLDGKFPITIGAEGILCVDEFQLIMKIMPMTADDFNAFKQSDEMWNLEDSRSSDDALGEFEVIPYRRLINHAITPYLIHAVKTCRKRLKNSIPPTPNNTVTVDSIESKSDLISLHQWRAARSRSFIQGQRSLLRLLIESVRVETVEA